MDDRLAQQLAAGELNARPVQPEASFDTMYQTPTPWDIGRPQPVFVEWAKAGDISGRVLDVGCGTGEHALLAAGLGLPATGVDIAASAIATAEGKARDRDLAGRFLVWDALDLGGLGEQFDTVLDSGTFHVFNDDERTRYVASLRAAMPPGARLLMLCFSDRNPGKAGLRPRHVRQDEIRASFANGWRVDTIEPAMFELAMLNAAQAWQATLTRT